jgi:hypothetical protein
MFFSVRCCHIISSPYDIPGVIFHLQNFIAVFNKGLPGKPAEVWHGKENIQNADSE